MKTFKQFQEEESALDMKRKELMRDKGKDAKDFKRDQKQQDMSSRIEKNKQETDQALSDMEKRNDLKMQQLRKDMTGGAGTPMVDAVVSGAKNVAGAVGNKLAQKKEKQMTDKKVQVQKKIMTKQHNLERQKMQQMKKST